MSWVKVLVSLLPSALKLAKALQDASDTKTARGELKRVEAVARDKAAREKAIREIEERYK